MRRCVLLFSLALALSALTACVSTAPAREGATFVVVRHAEKADNSRDPALNEAGRARAQVLAARLVDAPLVAAYASEYRRTQQTAQPAADGHGLAIAGYGAAQPAQAFAAQLRASHRAGTVLVVGHSNTVPAIVAALCGCETAPMDDGEYDRLSEVRIDAGDRTRLTITRYGADSASP